MDQLGLERFTLVVHDWGAVGLALAQRFPERIERLRDVLDRAVRARLPLAPRGARLADPVLGELLMGFTTRWGLRRELPPSWRTWRGTRSTTAPSGRS